MSEQDHSRSLHGVSITQDSTSNKDGLEPDVVIETESLAGSMMDTTVTVTVDDTVRVARTRTCVVDNTTDEDDDDDDFNGNNDDHKIDTDDHDVETAMEMGYVATKEASKGESGPGPGSGIVLSEGQARREVEKEASEKQPIHAAGSKYRSEVDLRSQYQSSQKGLQMQEQTLEQAHAHAQDRSQTEEQTQEQTEHCKDGASVSVPVSSEVPAESTAVKSTESDADPRINKQRNRNAELSRQISQLEAENGSGRSALRESDAAATIARHIALLHGYNKIKDVGLGLMGMIADRRRVRVGEIMEEFGIDAGD